MVVEISWSVGKSKLELVPSGSGFRVRGPEWPVVSGWWLVGSSEFRILNSDFIFCILSSSGCED
jgi:hypothetical protein